MTERNGVHIEDGERARAFNLGSDARLAGVPFTACESPCELKAMWQDGWLDVHRFWGHWSKTPVKRLPWVPEPDLKGSK